MMQRGCITCCGLLVSGKEVWREGETLITNLYVPVCVECEMEEDWCTCNDKDEKILEFAKANGYLPSSRGL
jgi:hypothetical protein